MDSIRKIAKKVKGALTPSQQTIKNFLYSIGVTPGPDSPYYSPRREYRTAMLMGAFA